MNVSQIVSNTTHRLRCPGTWGAVALFGLLWNGLRWVTGPESLSLGEFLLPFAFGALLLLSAASPWQWTGDDRPVAPFLRGIIQALPWNALLLLLLVALLPERGGRGGRGGVTVAWLPSLPPRLLVLLVACGAFGMLAGWILADRDQEAQRGEVQAQRADAQAKLARAAQSRALQSQMNPHVLFNALSGLAELAREDRVATEEALVGLAGLLRRLLDHSARASVALGEERDLVEALLALERFRLGDRLKVRWRWDVRFEDTEVPPLLLQPLVENALKHGIVPSRTGGEVEIGLEGNHRHLRLWVANTGKAMESPSPGGVGLANLRERLSLIEAPRCRFDLRMQDGLTLAELHLEFGDA